MDQEQAIEQENEVIALAEERLEETEDEQAEAEEEEAEPEDFEIPKKPSVGTVELFLMIMLSSAFWILAIIPFGGFLFSGFGILCIWLWYKFKKLNPPSFSTGGQLAQIASKGAGAATQQGEELVKKIPGGSDFLFFFGAFTIDSIPFLDFIPALPALVIAIYLANRG